METGTDISESSVGCFQREFTGRKLADDFF
jgi:hypothetical protein